MIKEPLTVCLSYRASTGTPAESHLAVPLRFTATIQRSTERAAASTTPRNP